MATLKELRDERLRKLDELKQLGLNPYPAKANRTHLIDDVVGNFASFEGKTVTVAGRVTGIRKFGQLAFMVVRDVSGQMQLFMKSDTVSALDAQQNHVSVAELPLLDTGDFVEATGPVIKTKTGEISVDVRDLR